jgi:hypothetical protein
MLSGAAGMSSAAVRVPIDAGRRAMESIGSGALEAVVAEVLGSLARPDAVARQIEGFAGSLRSAAGQLLVIDPARSPLWRGRRSLGRAVEVLSFDLEEARASSHSLGGTLNDLYVSGVLGGVGAYHRRLGVPVGDLRVSVPLNIRTDRSAGGNAFVPSRVLLPAGVEDPVERFEDVHDRLMRVKGGRGPNLVSALAGIVTVLPQPLIARVAQAQVGTVDFAASNVRGAPFELYVAGSLVLANYPVGPTGGTAFNASLLTYRSSMDIGVSIDTAAIPDATILRACVFEGLAETIAAGA